MRVNQCAETNQASAFVTEPSLAHDLTRSIFQTSPDQFVDLVFSNLKGEAKITLKADFERVKRCFTLAQTRTVQSASELTFADMQCLLNGLIFTLVYHPTFFLESRRENMIALMADRVVEQLFGPWPTVGQPVLDGVKSDAKGKPLASIGNTIKRTRKVSLSELWSFIIGQKKPFDAWDLMIDGVHCNVINQWDLRQPNCQFIIGHKVVAENHDSVSVKGAIPILSVQVKGASGQTHLVEVFCKAVLSTNIRVSVNGQAITHRFI